MTDDQFVINLYSSLLQRSPKSEEVRHWTSMLARGTSRSDVVETFMSSSEFISLQTQKERFRVSFPKPVEAPPREQDVISALQNHVVRKRGMGYEAQVPATRTESAPLEEGVSDVNSRMATVSARVHQAQQAVGQLNPRSPSLTGYLGQAVKRTMQRSLTWYTRSLRSFSEQVVSGLDEQGSSIVALAGSLQSHNDQLAQLSSQMTKFRREYLDSLIRETELATQEHFIPYLEFFRALSPVLDLGCGRGEFLALLKENGISAYGVDSDADACEIVRGKTLQAVQQDMFEHLRQLPNRSLGGIFSARVIEFVPLHLQMELISLCSEKLKPGGVLLIDTTNPDSRHGYGRVNFMDATHFRPVPPELMKSGLENSHFHDVQIMFPSVQVASVVGNGNDTQSQISTQFIPRPSKDLLTGPVYAVMGWRI